MTKSHLDTEYYIRVWVRLLTNRTGRGMRNEWNDELAFKPFTHSLVNFIFVSVSCILMSNNEILLSVDYSNNTYSKRPFSRYVCNSNISQRFFHFSSIVRTPNEKNGSPSCIHERYSEETYFWVMIFRTCPECVRGWILVQEKIFWKTYGVYN